MNKSWSKALAAARRSETETDVKPTPARLRAMREAVSVAGWKCGHSKHAMVLRTLRAAELVEPPRMRGGWTTVATETGRAWLAKHDGKRCICGHGPGAHRGGVDVCFDDDCAGGGCEEYRPTKQ